MKRIYHAIGLGIAALAIAAYSLLPKSQEPKHVTKEPVVQVDLIPQKAKKPDSIIVFYKSVPLIEHPAFQNYTNEEREAKPDMEEEIEKLYVNLRKEGGNHLGRLLLKNPDGNVMHVKANSNDIKAVLDEYGVDHPGSVTLPIENSEVKDIMQKLNYNAPEDADHARIVPLKPLRVYEEWEIF